MTTTPSSIFSPSRALLIAGGIIAISLALALLSPEVISDEVARRAVGVMLGLLVVPYANAVPKMLAPMAQIGGNAALDQRLRRFAGITLVLGGLGNAGAWLLAPLGRAAMIGGGLLASSVLLVMARIAWAMARAPRKEDK